MFVVGAGFSWGEHTLHMHFTWFMYVKWALSRTSIRSSCVGNETWYMHMAQLIATSRWIACQEPRGPLQEQMGTQSRIFLFLKVCKQEDGNLKAHRKPSWIFLLSSDVIFFLPLSGDEERTSLLITVKAQQQGGGAGGVHNDSSRHSHIPDCVSSTQHGETLLLPLCGPMTLLLLFRRCKEDLRRLLHAKYIHDSGSNVWREIFVMVPGFAEVNVVEDVFLCSSDGIICSACYIGQLRPVHTNSSSRQWRSALLRSHSDWFDAQKN